MSVGPDYVGMIPDLLDLMLRSPGVPVTGRMPLMGHPVAPPVRPSPIPAVGATGMGGDLADPYNPMNAQAMGGGIQIDPRYMQALASGMMTGSGNAGLPDFAPMVPVQQAQPHPTLSRLAEAILPIAQSYFADPYNRRNTGLAGVLGFLGGAARPLISQSQQVDATNQQRALAAAQVNQLNWLASQEAAKEGRAFQQQKALKGLDLAGKERPPSSLIPLTPDMLTQSGVTGYTPGQPVPLDVWKAVQSEATRRTPKPVSARMDLFGGKFDPDAVAIGIHNNEFSPDSKGRSRGQWGEVETSYHNLFPGENLQEKQADWTRFTTNIRTMEGTKFTNMGVNLNATDAAISLARQYSNELSQAAPRYAVTPVNRLAQMVQQNYNFGGPEQSAAVSRFVSQVGATRLQLAGVYMNGGTPTEQAMRHADQILDGTKPPAALAAQLDVAQADVRLRRAAYDEARMKRGTSQYGDHPVAPRAGYIRIVHGDGTEADYPAGKPIPAGWRQE